MNKSSTRLSALLCAALPLLTVACSTTGSDIKAESVVDPKVDLAGYTSVAWLAAGQALSDPNGEWVRRGFDIDSEVRFQIEKQLRDRGLSIVTRDPDAYLAYLLLVNMDASEEQIQNIFGESADLTNLKAGALVVALVDPVTVRAIWAGAATAQPRGDASDEESKARLAVAIKKIFAGYPK